MTLSTVKDIATITGVLLALVTLVKGYIEYRRAAKLKRAEQFGRMRQTFVGDGVVRQVADRLEADQKGMAEVSPEHKRIFVCFFEEVALLLKARLIRPELAHYMFGYLAVRSDMSEFFWTTSFPRDELYWSLFLKFVERMKTVEAAKKKDRAAYVRRLRL